TRATRVLCPICQLRGKVGFKCAAYLIGALKQRIVSLVQRRFGVALLDDSPCPINETSRTSVASNKLIERRTVAQLSTFSNPARKTCRHLAPFNSPLMFHGQHVTFQCVDSRNEFPRVAIW